jgi:hypothetical protein
MTLLGVKIEKNLEYFIFRQVTENATCTLREERIPCLSVTWVVDPIYSLFKLLSAYENKSLPSPLHS